ncbi:MAG: hypothetical protein WB868_05230, partial [Xanthobacteraceae bacterium]
LAVKLRDYRRLAPVGKLAQITLETSNASVPPGWTAEQFAMKSKRQLARMALVWATVGCCASPEATPVIRTNPAASAARPAILPANWRFQRESCGHQRMS